MNATCQIIATKRGKTRPVYNLDGHTIERLGSKRFFADGKRYVSFSGAVAGILSRTTGQTIGPGFPSVNEAVAALYAAEKEASK